ncbi:glycosyltransferase family 4 protein [Exiguobacterium sp. PHA03]|uniref:glycosyltransferase family 4 protein n=1 Tax=Exiguobacterium sp. PHA03 TaxID=3064895 RepID=UPI0035BFC172
MNNLLHISSNVFKDLNNFHATRKIWEELAKGFDEYHILARSENNKYSYTKDNNIHLHLIPNLKNTKLFFFTSIYMKKIIKKYNINFMLSQCSILGGPLATYYSKKYSIPLMVEIHGMEYFRYLESKKWRHYPVKKIMYYVFNNSQKIRSLSLAMTEMLSNFNITKNVVEIPNRVNIKLFNPPKSNYNIDFSEIKIISIGRFVWEKNYEMAIEVISNLEKKYNGISLTLIGDGPLKNKYLDQIASKKANVNLISWKNQEEMVPLLRESDIYIQTSKSEGVPRTIIEAMALKLPIISTDVGAIKGIIKNNVNGILVENNNSEVLENKIIDLINDKILREKMSEEAYKDVLENYEWNKVFTKYRNEIKSMRC